jgi:hypothetical protein
MRQAGRRFHAAATHHLHGLSLALVLALLGQRASAAEAVRAVPVGVVPFAMRGVEQAM